MWSLCGYFFAPHSAPSQHTITDVFCAGGGSIRYFCYLLFIYMYAAFNLVLSHMATVQKTCLILLQFGKF